jgi:hypothetical protein
LQFVDVRREHGWWVFGAYVRDQQLLVLLHIVESAKFDINLAFCFGLLQLILAAEGIVTKQSR